MIRILAASFLMVYAASIAEAQTRLASLPTNERSAMLTYCNRFADDDKMLCAKIVNDERVGVNTKRSCIEALQKITATSTFERFRGLPPTTQCVSDLREAGYNTIPLLKRIAAFFARK